MHIGIIIKRIAKGIGVYFSNSKNARDSKIWVFGEWFGSKCGDNSTYLANYIAKNYPEYKIYWICKKKCNTEVLDKHIRVKYFEEDDTIDLLKKADVAIMSQGYGDFSVDECNYFGNAFTVNLWHGILWKTIGYDTYNRNKFYVRLFTYLLSKTQSFDAFLSVSDSYTGLFKHAFRQTKATPILAGYPRNECLYDKTFVLKQREEIKKRIGIEKDSNEIIIVYMPTYRDGARNFSFESLSQNNDFLKLISDNNLFIIQKTHFASQRNNNLIQESGCKRIINIENINPQSLLAAADILITDYSGCFYDFLILDRPIIHFVYDYDEYSKNERGLYYSIEEVYAGEIAKTKEELLIAIKNSISSPNAMYSRRNEVREKYLTYESDQSCKKIFDQIRYLKDMRRK